MKYTVDPWNNFCRVFELPTRYPTGYCFNGGKPSSFLMVDWFNPVPDIRQSAITKEQYEKAIKEGAPVYRTAEIDSDELQEFLSPFISGKNYIKKDSEYLVICEFGFTFIVNGNK